VENDNLGKISQYKTGAQGASSRKGGVLIAIEVIVRGRRIHDTLVEAAGELFQDLGYTRVSIRAIVAKANVPKGTFYNYFSSKEALASLIVEQQFEAVSATLPAICDRSCTRKLNQHFQATVTRVPSQSVSPMRLLVTFAAEAPALPPAMKKKIAAGFESWSSRLADLILQAQAQTQLREGQDAQQLADFLINAWQGAIIRAKCDRTSEPLRTFARFALEICSESLWGKK
jgi:TetR/AcrR family transcriptional repressor of nem operon